MLLDTSAWIEVFKSSNKGLIVKEYLQKTICFTSEISFAEISKWAKSNNQDLDYCINIIKDWSVVISLNEITLKEAGVLCFERRKKIKDFGLIDSIILTTAKLRDLQIVTTDSHFAGIENVILLK